MNQNTGSFSIYRDFRIFHLQTILASGSYNFLYRLAQTYGSHLALRQEEGYDFLAIYADFHFKQRKSYRLTSAYNCSKNEQGGRDGTDTPMFLSIA